MYTLENFNTISSTVALVLELTDQLNILESINLFSLGFLEFKQKHSIDLSDNILERIQLQTSSWGITSITSNHTNSIATGLKLLVKTLSVFNDGINKNNEFQKSIPGSASEILSVHEKLPQVLQFATSIDSESSLIVLEYLRLIAFNYMKNKIKTTESNVEVEIFNQTILQTIIYKSLLYSNPKETLDFLTEFNIPLPPLKDMSVYNFILCYDAEET